MKILDFSPYYPPHIGGLEKYAEELHENLAKKDCRITAFVPRLPVSSLEKESDLGITIIRYAAFDIIPNFPVPCFWKKEFREQWEKISQENYDLTISTSRFFVQPLMACLFAKRRKIPRLHIEHGSDFVRNKFFINIISRIFDYTIGWFVLKNADRIIAPSASAMRFVKRLSGREAKVIYRGMPFEEIDTIEPANEIKERYTDKKIITYVGRLIFGKGIIHLLEMILALKRTDFVLLIVGDGPERKTLEQFTADNKISDKVIFLGSVPFEKAISILKVSDIFVNPSYNEGLPTSVLEAGITGTAIVATNVGGTPEIITNEKSGLIIPKKDNTALQKSIEILLDDPEKRKFFTENARKEIENKFNWESSVTAYLKELESIIKK